MTQVESGIWRVTEPEWCESEGNVLLPGYYFQDEAYGLNGPYDTYLLAHRASESYARHALCGKTDETAKIIDDLRARNVWPYNTVEK